MKKSLADIVRAYLSALDALHDANERGGDDSGTRPTPTMREWTILSCEHDETLAALRAAVAR